MDPAIVIRAVYEVGVNFTAHSYEAPHSKKLWGLPYVVECPIANTYEVDQLAIAIRACSVWSELYDRQLRSSPQQNAMGLTLCQVPHSKHL